MDSNKTTLYLTHSSFAEPIEYTGEPMYYKYNGRYGYLFISLGKVYFIATDAHGEAPEQLNWMIDSDQNNYEFAKEVFEKEEGRRPNMNDQKDMNVVAILEVGIKYSLNQ